jgi:hypothetical protein
MKKILFLFLLTALIINDNHVQAQNYGSQYPDAADYDIKRSDELIKLIDNVVSSVASSEKTNRITTDQFASLEYQADNATLKIYQEFFPFNESVSCYSAIYLAFYKNGNVVKEIVDFIPNMILGDDGTIQKENCDSYIQYGGFITVIKPRSVMYGYRKMPGYSFKNPRARCSQKHKSKKHRNARFEKKLHDALSFFERSFN